ncbi:MULTISPECIES: ferredoxin--NADP reductase [Pseudoalteromonas]|uniref:ferredoxin--NADP(+) reductase n=1 Tax=Pseudoalteromonas amylolytica TaxID=1859457 RepID=A0A1S1MZ28_9GAMM|nr:MULTISPECIES: ferredoxin--NADP reductase [Pseudoalteromonas]OHU90215.1 ferredoxin--NADP(+) reductase [Pseudoalteromonas sp. JW3]OHU92418.1 ferredoxin--NADP(+) reductase [Pseudoalteromonas amylolytica]
MAKWTTGHILEINWWTPSLFSLRISAHIQPFKAGQFTKLALQVGDKRIARAYSFVNPPQDPILEFYLIEVPDGSLSERLAELKVGDEIMIEEQANGFLTLDEIPYADTLWMLSTGTAIGPFLSIIAQGELWNRFKNVVLVHGVRNNIDLTYQDRIKTAQKSFPQLHYVPAVSREQPELGLSGRITNLLDSGELVKYCGYDALPKSSHFMLCGNPQMVKDTTNLLISKGFERHRRAKPGHITVEQYW